jgi:c(7)-type cytochrome triheme protein
MNRCIAKQVLAACVTLCVAQTTFGAGPVSQANSYWLPLAQDELHDPADTSLHLLKNPGKTLSALPRDGAGNQVNWVKALDNNFINPRINLRADTQVEVLDLDILFPDTGEMNMVKFPHKQHTEWLVCSNCHEEIFKYKPRAIKFGMFEILNGEYCGRCHGAVAFPPTECNRCHNMPRTSTVAPAKAN